MNGDPTALEMRVRRYQQVLFTVAWRLTGDVEDARDVTQNAFVRAYLNLAVMLKAHAQNNSEGWGAERPPDDDDLVQVMLVAGGFEPPTFG